MFAEDAVERIGDLQRLFVPGDGDDLDAESFDEPGIVGRHSTIGRGDTALHGTIGRAGTSGRKLLMGAQEHLGAEPLWSLDPSQLGSIEVSPYHCTVPGPHSARRIRIVWSIQRGFGVRISVDRPDNSFRSAICTHTCAHVRVHIPLWVSNDSPDSIDHGQDRDDRLGAGLHRGTHTMEDIGRGQTPRRIMDEHDFGIAYMFQGILH